MRELENRKRIREEIKEKNTEKLCNMIKEMKAAPYEVRIWDDFVGIGTTCLFVPSAFEPASPSRILNSKHKQSSVKRSSQIQKRQ